MVVVIYFSCCQELNLGNTFDISPGSSSLQCDEHEQRLHNQRDCRH